MFADDFVGLTTNAENLQKLINVVQEFCNKWRLKSNIKKSAVMVFSKEVVKGTCTWTWGIKRFKGSCLPFILQAHTSLPYSKVGQSTETNNNYPSCSCTDTPIT